MLNKSLLHNMTTITDTYIQFDDNSTDETHLIVNKYITSVSIHVNKNCVMLTTIGGSVYEFLDAEAEQIIPFSDTLKSKNQHITVVCSDVLNKSESLSSSYGKETNFICTVFCKYITSLSNTYIDLIGGCVITINDNEVLPLYKEYLLEQ